MLKYSRKWIWLALLLSTVAADGARSQWRIVATGLIPAGGNYGAICYHDGIVWLSAQSLFMSIDSGLTWTSKSLPQTVTQDIDFESPTEGVFTCGGTWTTSDAGTSWKQITQTGATSACFLNNANAIALAGGTTPLGVTTDGGNTWRDMPPQVFQFCIKYKAGTIYEFGGDSSGAFIFSSTDFGITWKQGKTGIDWDSYSFAVDSCDPNRIYLSHEDVVAPTDQYSKIFLSTDRGDTWQTIISHPLPFFCGSVAEGNSAIYCQSVAQGVFRSTDRGMTWRSIGGPSTEIDTRLIAAINDNILLAVDNNGNVWRTDNSGGDSIALPQFSASNALIIPSQPVTISQIVCATPADTSIHLNIVGCGTPTGILDSLWLTGPSAFQIADSRKSPRSLASEDSILVSYKSSNGPDTSVLHLRYDIGFGARDTTIQLIGVSVAPSVVSGSARLHREAADAYVGQLDSLVLGVDIGSGVNIDSLWPYVSDIRLTYRWDSSVVKFASYLPTKGCTVTSVMQRGNAVDIAIHNDSSTASSPLDLGTALFRPSNDKLATTWVQLPRLVLYADCKELSLSVTYDEDNHWAVTTLGAQSGVLNATTDGKIIAIYPNPASGNIWITSSADLGNVTFSIYDMLGTKRGEIVASVLKDNPIELTLPQADGVYNIVVNYGAGTSTVRLVREHN
jgi:photosystem II stability/assembly factor-like uncharacterized protein